MYWGRMKFRGHHPHGPHDDDNGATRVERFIEPCILLLLAEEKRHGYSLRDELVSRQFVSDVDLGLLYRTLRRMEQAELVSSEWEEQGPGPLKRVYSLTPAGRQVLTKWVESLRQTRQVLDKFLRAFDSFKRE